MTCFCFCYCQSVFFITQLCHFSLLNLFSPSSQSRCVHCETSQPQTSSPDSCPCSGRIWRSIWHAATPTQCPCVTATPWREAVEAITPPCESAWQWNTTPHASPCVTCRPTTASMSVCHWPTQRGRKRAERSPSRPRRTVSPGGGYRKESTETGWKLRLKSGITKRNSSSEHYI